ncbi:hypothetical protein ABPG72_002802 [Tetrahymena utriculariae]
MANLIGAYRIQQNNKNYIFNNVDLHLITSKQRLLDCFQKEIPINNLTDIDDFQAREINIELVHFFKLYTQIYFVFLREEGFKSKNFESCDSCFFPYFMKANNQIKQLELLLGNNHISDKFVVNLIDNLSNKIYLSELLLDFSYNIIKKESIFLITQCICNILINLSKLALYLTGNNGFKNQEINIDIGFLQRINSFYIDIANNNISQQGFCYLKQIIKQQAQNLTNFEINFRNNQQEADIQEMNELIYILQDKPYIQTIQVNDFKKTPLQILFILATYFFQVVLSDVIKQQTITVKFYQNQSNYVLDSTLLNLQFSTELPTITTDILQKYIDIKLKNLVNNVDFTWQAITKVSNDLFQTKINYKTSIYVKQLYLYFINPYAIHNQNSNYLSLDSYTISVNVGPVVFFESYQNQEINISQEGLNLFWAFVDLIQLYNLFLFLDTNHFENVSKLLKQCNILNFWYIDFINKYQDTSFMKHAIENPSQSAITNLPYPFIQNQYTSYFILNSFFPLFIVGIGIFLMLTSLIVCPQSRFRSQGVLLNLAQLSLLIRGIINIVTCIVTIVYYTICILAFSYVLNIGQSIPLAQQQTKDKYGSLYEGLILKAVLKRNFNIFFMLRKIIMIIFIIFLDKKQMLQMIFVLIVYIIFMGLLSSKLPYEYSKNNVWMVTSEFYLSGFLLLMSAWVVFDYLGEDFIFFSKKMALSWVIQSIIFMSIFFRCVGIQQEQSDSIILDETTGVRQKLILYHDNLKGVPQANPNEDVENPDDFQYIEMADINELIKEDQKLQQKENVIQGQQPQQFLVYNEENNNNENDNNNNNNNHVSDDDDANTQNQH